MRETTSKTLSSNTSESSRSLPDPQFQVLCVPIGVYRSVPTSRDVDSLADASGARFYKSQLEAKRRGIKVHYGDNREHWKVTAQIHGRTKFSRTPGARQAKARNDGRPPDAATGKALLGHRKNAKQKGPAFEKGYKWKDNSCWLDSSVTAISSALSRDFGRSMEPLFAALPTDHPLRSLQQVVHTRLAMELPGYADGGCSVLSKQRDGFRKYLLDLPNSPLISLTSFQSLFGWLYHIVKIPIRSQETPLALERAISIFRVSTHFQLERIRWLEQIHVRKALCERDMQKWFSLDPPWQSPARIRLVLIVEIRDIAGGHHSTGMGDRVVHNSGVQTEGKPEKPRQVSSTQKDVTESSSRLLVPPHERVRFGGWSVQRGLCTTIGKLDAAASRQPRRVGTRESWMEKECVGEG
ncbi:hypothetical protein C8R47DRAFT_1200004 [Mycena vitilis]|nr:hypothetical protein C8R47DRAFT_1200004 [Mycena vitilis]